jgi:hypothetical protein
MSNKTSPKKQRPFLRPILNTNLVCFALPKTQREIFQAYAIVMGMSYEATLQYFLTRGMDDVLRSGVLGKALETRATVKRILKNGR